MWRYSFRAIAFACVIAFSALPARAELLLDYGSQANGLGHPIAGRNIFGGLYLIQQFSVVGAALHVDTIGTDGWVIQDPLGLGMRGTLFADNGIGTPDWTNPLGSAVYHLGSDPYSSNWQDEEFDITLQEGDYWMLWSHNGDPNYAAGLFDGETGPNAYSKQGSSTGFICYPSEKSSPLRIMGVPGPASLTLLALGLLNSRKRRC